VFTKTDIINEMADTLIRFYYMQLNAHSKLIVASLLLHNCNNKLHYLRINIPRNYTGLTPDLATAARVFTNKASGFYF
jgi:hypothetical protein